MSATEIDAGFAHGVRAELAAIGTRGSGLQRNQRRARAIGMGIGALALVGATTGAAVVVYGLPGATSVAALGNSVEVTHTGSANIDLGAAPANATVVVIDLTCISQTGQLALLTVPGAGSAGPDGAGVNCEGIEGRTVRVSDGLLPAIGTTSITITADPETTWTASAQYGTSTTTEWGVNENGQTYGVANVHGVPDLIPATASNGEWGYVYSFDAEAVEGDGFLDVFKSDGTTLIGQQPFQSAENIPVDESKIPRLSPGGSADQ